MMLTMRSIRLLVAILLAGCTSQASPVTVGAPAPSSAPAAWSTAAPTPGTTQPTASIGLASAGAAPDAGVLLIQGPDNRIYRYDGATGLLTAISAAATFAGERADGALVVGIHGSADLIGWDGTVHSAVCGQGTVIAVAATGACAFSGDGTDTSVYVRLPGDAARRQLLPADWAAGGLVWDPTGTRLALTRSLSGPDLATRLHDALWLIDTDGTPREIYRPAGPSAYVYSLGWSPDGRFITARQQGIVSASLAMDGVELLLIEVATGRVTSLGTVWGYRWSDDGRLAFVRGAGRETWSNKQLMVRAPDGRIVQVSAGDRIGLAPAWAPSDGGLAWVDAPAGNGLKDAAYVNGLGPGARRGAVLAGGGVALAAIDCGDRVVEGVRWSADNQLLLLCRRPGDVARPLELWLRRFATNGPVLVPLVTGLGDDTLRGFGVYGAHPSLFGLVAWSKAVPDARLVLLPTLSEP